MLTFSVPFTLFLNKVIVLLIGFIYMFQPSHPCSTGFNPVMIDVVAAVVVAGNTVVISFTLFLLKNESSPKVLSNILEPIPSNNIITTFVGCFSFNISSI